MSSAAVVEPAQVAEPIPASPVKSEARYHPVRSLIGVASSLYQRLSPYAPTVVVKGVEKVQSLSEPLVSKYAAPLVDKLDTVASGAAERVSDHVATVVIVKNHIANDLKERRVPYFAEGKEILTNLVASRAETLQQVVFLSAFSDAIKKVAQSGRELKVAEIVQDMKARLGHLWHDGLVVPIEQHLLAFKGNVQAAADAVTRKANRAMTGLQQQVPAEWQTQASDMFKSVSMTSKKMYNDALAELVRMHANGLKCTVDEFVAAVQSKMGDKWEVRFRPMLMTLYRTFPVGKINIETLHVLLDVKEDRPLTVRDFVNAGVHFATQAQDAAHAKWQGVLRRGMNMVDRMLPPPAETCATSVEAEAKGKEIKEKEDDKAKLQREQQLTVLAVVYAAHWRLSARVHESLHSVRDMLASQLSLEHVRRVSRERVQAVIRVDVVAIAEAALLKGHTIVVQWKDSAAEVLKLKEHIEQLQRAAKAVRTRAHVLADQVHNRTAAAANYVRENAIVPFQQRVTEPLRVRAVRAKEYASECVTVILTQADQKVVARVKPHLEALKLKARARAQQARDACSRVFQPVSQKALARWQQARDLYFRTTTYLLDTPLSAWMHVPHDIVLTTYTRMHDGAERATVYLAELRRHIPFLRVVVIEQPKPQTASLPEPAPASASAAPAEASQAQVALVPATTDAPAPATTEEQKEGAQ